MKSLKIEEVKGREILDSRGNPTVEVEVAVGEGILGLEGHMGACPGAVRGIDRKI